MNAIPLSEAMAEKNFWNAPNPPAEAPMPTTGNGNVCLSGSAAGSASAGGRVALGDGRVSSGDGWVLSSDRWDLSFFFFAATAASSSRR